MVNIQAHLRFHWLAAAPYSVGWDRNCNHHHTHHIELSDVFDGCVDFVCEREIEDDETYVNFLQISFHPVTLLYKAFLSPVELAKI